MITTSTLYTSHLHGIYDIEEDQIIRDRDEQTPLLAELGVQVANWKLVTGEEARRAVELGGTLRRGTRYSLTCRDVKRVAIGKMIRNL